MVDREKIQRARRTDLVAYLIAKGEHLKRVGKNFTIVGKSNIVFIYEGHKEWQGVSSEIMNSTNKRLTDFIFASDLLKEMRQAVTGKQ